MSSRTLERASYESSPCRYVAGNLHPDHDTIAHFRRAFLAEVQEAVVQVLLVAQQVGVLELAVASQDGTTIHADAAKSQAVSSQRLGELAPQLRAAVAAWLALAEQAEAREVPAGLDVGQEVARRQARLEQLALAKAARTGRKPDGRPPPPPPPGPRATDQDNFTDPESRIIKNSTDAGFDQHSNAQLVVDQASLLVVGPALSNHPNDQGEVAPTLDAIAPAVGVPAAVARDAGFFSAANSRACARRGIEPYIAPGREAHQRTLAELLAPGRGCRWPTSCAPPRAKRSLGHANGRSRR